VVGERRNGGLPADLGTKVEPPRLSQMQTQLGAPQDGFSVIGFRHAVVHCARNERPKRDSVAKVICRPGR
jgi:hypothetical protein